MKKASFLERSAHLSYVAPLIAGLFLLQLGDEPGPASLALVVALLLGGLFSAFAGARWLRRERGRRSWAAWLGFALNGALLLSLVGRTLLL